MRTLDVNCMSDEVQLDENGLNNKIEGVILDESTMLSRGFRRMLKGFYFGRTVGCEITLNIHIYDDPNKRLTIDVLDEDFCQPYDYQRIISMDSANTVAPKVKDRVDYWLEKLSREGIIVGFKRGMYV